MQKIYILVLMLILLAACILRLHNFQNPIADWHAWRQADTSSVSRNFVKQGFDILHPRFDDLSNVPSGLDNPNGYRFVEFPLFNILQAGFFKTLGIFSIEEWGRLVSIFGSLGSITFLYLFVRKYAGQIVGLLSAFFFAFIPYNIYYDRTILPDPSMIFAILGGIYFFDKWIEKNSKGKTQNQVRLGQNYLYFTLSLLLVMVALLLKPYALFFTPPFFWIAWMRFGRGILRRWQLWIFLFLALIPLAFWRIWMTQYPEGIPVSSWLFNGEGIRFKGAFFYWLFADRLARLILGYWGLPLFVLGLLSITAKTSDIKKSSGLFFSFLISSLLYLTVIAKGNVQHDYYQILIIPTISIFLALGCNFLFSIAKEQFSSIASYVVCILCIIFMLSFGWYFIRDYFNINNPSIVSAGDAVDKLIPKDAKIIANYNGDTSFLYQTKRQGWASFEKPVPEMIKMGASYLILVNPSSNDLEIGRTYKIISSTPQYILFDLNQTL